MTLVQASIANNGNSVILIADRLLTSKIGEDVPSYEFEWNKPKILSFKKIGIGFAGAALFADMIEREISGIKDKDFDNIVKKISNFIKKEKNRFVEQYIVRHTGISSKDFFNRPPDIAIPPEVIEAIYAFMAQFDLEFECIVCGFDKKNNVRLIGIDNQGNIFELTNFGIVTIGSGSPFSKIYFDLYNYTTTVPEKDGLFFAYRAKKWAEASTGVGACTDILIINKNKEALLISDESQLMKEIDSCHKKEIKNRDDLREKLMKDLDIKIRSGK